MKRFYFFAAAAAACLLGPPAQASAEAEKVSTPAADAEKKVPSSRESKLLVNPVALEFSRETSLVSVSITPSQPEAVVLVLATVALAHTGGAGDKMVTLRLFRDGVPIEGVYTVRLGVSSRAVSDFPVTLHAWDVPGAGSHAYTVTAKTNGSGAQATLRRLSLIELP